MVKKKKKKFKIKKVQDNYITLYKVYNSLEIQKYIFMNIITKFSYLDIIKLLKNLNINYKY